MSVDKFGRFSEGGTRKHSLRGPKGEGFDLTPEGDYDIKAKRMRFLSEPEEDTDAVNLKFLKEHSLVGENGILNAKGHTITNLKDPANDSDAVTRSYFFDHCPDLVTSDTYKAWSFRKLRLMDVQMPMRNGDAVNLAHLKHYCPGKDEDGWNFRNKRLVAVAHPVGDNDAATLGEVKRSNTDLRRALENLRKDISKNLNESLDKLDKKHRIEIKRFAVQLYRTFRGTPTGSYRTDSVQEDNYIDWDEVYREGELI